MSITEKARAYTERVEHPLALLVIIGIAIRLVVSPLFTFNIDMGYWTHVVGVFENGFGLYGTAGYYYTPIWGYTLGAVTFVDGLLGIADRGMFFDPLAPMVNEMFKVSDFVTSIAFNFSVKIPLILADIAVTVLLYKLVLRFTQDNVKAILTAGLWVLSPLVIAESSFHGTFDNMSVMFILLSLMFCFDRKYFIGGAAFGLAVFTKFFPIFFIFFLIALVLKQEGIDKNGAKKLGMAIAGAIVATVVIYIPNIARGDFWSSLYFLAYRMGISRETLAGIGTTQSIIIIGALAVVIIAFLFIISKFGERIVSSLKDKKKEVAKVLGIVAAAVIILYAIKLLLSVIRNDTSGIESAGMSVVTMITIFSVFLEIYLAYRLLIIDKPTDKQILTILMLSALAIILWPCAPSYSLIVLPFVIIYACTVDERYIIPSILLSVFMAFKEITAFTTMLTSLSLYTGLIDPAIIVGIFEFLVYPVIMGIPGSWFLDAPAAVLSYLSLIGISIIWYYEYYRRSHA